MRRARSLKIFWVVLVVEILGGFKGIAEVPALFDCFVTIVRG